MEEVKKEVLEEQAAEQEGQAQEAPLSESERKAVKSNFVRNAVIMAAGFVLGYMLGRMIFTELRMLAYVCGMVVSGIVASVYIKK